LCFAGFGLNGEAECSPNPSVLEIPTPVEETPLNPNSTPRRNSYTKLETRSKTEPVLVQRTDVYRNYYTGKLGRKRKIQMDLKVDSHDVSGHYYDESRGAPTLLKGKINEKGVVTLNEFVKVFRGKFTSSLSIFEGKRLRPKRRRTLRLKLKRVAEYLFLETKDGAIEVHTEFPLFLASAPQMQQANMNLLNATTAEHYKFVYEGKKIYEKGGNLVPRGWERHKDTSVKYYSKDLVSLFTSTWEYTGGSHGNTSYSSTNYWMKNDNVTSLQLSDLFTLRSNYIKALSDYCIKDLQKQEASYVTSGKVKGLDEDALSAFWIKPTFLGFAFQPYLLGPHREGSYIVRVPYEALKDLINPEGPLKQFVKFKGKKSKKDKKRKRRRRRRR
jgi:hypothetical protein